jgi:hypothetical protein
LGKGAFLCFLLIKYNNVIISIINLSPYDYGFMDE